VEQYAQYFKKGPLYMSANDDYRMTDQHDNLLQASSTLSGPAHTRIDEMLQDLRLMADGLAQDFVERMLHEHKTRPNRERGLLGLRVRQAPRSGPGIVLGCSI
jgi:hypothetical protein